MMVCEYNILHIIRRPIFYLKQIKYRSMDNVQK
jgi:hypothetical protein